MYGMIVIIINIRTASQYSGDESHEALQCFYARIMEAVFGTNQKRVASQVITKLLRTETNVVRNREEPKHR